jgi:hypothetical protein
MYEKRIVKENDNPIRERGGREELKNTAVDKEIHLENRICFNFIYLSPY